VKVAGEHAPDTPDLPLRGEQVEVLQRCPPLALEPRVDDEPHLRAPDGGEKQRLDQGRYPVTPPDIQVGQFQHDALLGPVQDGQEVAQVRTPALGSHQQADLAGSRGESRWAGGRQSRQVDRLRRPGFERHRRHAQVVVEHPEELPGQVLALHHRPPTPATVPVEGPGREGGGAPVLGGDHHSLAVDDAVLLVVVPVGSMALALHR